MMGTEGLEQGIKKTERMTKGKVTYLDLEPGIVIRMEEVHHRLTKAHSGSYCL